MPRFEPVRLAVVGAGRMGRTHLRALGQAPSIALAAVVDPVAAVREELAAAGHRVHADAEELLAAGGIDAVLVAAPTDLHVALVRTFAGAGLPILCEKPLGFGPEEAAQASDAAARAGVLLQVGFWRRFVPALVELRERIGAGELGELSLVSCWQWDERPPGAEFRRRSGGILVDMGVHEFDQLRWLTGSEIDGVAAFAATTVSDPPVPGDPETVQAVARLSGGAVGAVSVGRRFPHGDCCWVEVMGTAGHVRCDFMWGADGKRVVLAAVAAQAEAFAAGVRDGVLRGAGGADAVAAVDAAVRAACA